MESKEEFYKALEDLLVVIDNQTTVITNRAEDQIKIMPYPDKVTVFHITDRNGKPVLSDMILAQAQVLSAMALLKVSAKK